jgi:hypothetical protein
MAYNKLMLGGSYKRPVGAAPLLGMNIGAKNYDDPVYQEALSRLDVAILGFYPGWRGDSDGSAIRAAVRAIKARNPAVKVGQYTIMNEAVSDPSKTANDDQIAKINQMGWWLKKADGRMLQWTTEYSAYEVNFSEWAPKDSDGDRYPQWLAKRDHQKFFAPVPEFDVWYFDNVFKNSRVSSADWKFDGVDVSSTDSTVAAGFRRGEVAHWATARSLAPSKMLMGNVDHDMSAAEYRQQLSGGFLEGFMGKSWSIVNQGWAVMMKRYFDTTSNLQAPAVVGFNVWGSPTDYRFFRYAFTSCLLGNAHFSFTDSAAGYSSVPWFDEYEVAFGAPVDAANYAVWSNGVYRRRDEHAMVLVNPNGDARTVTVDPGWRRVLARQDASVNNGMTVTTLTLQPKDGIVLVRD